MNVKHSLTEGPIIRSLLALSVPIILANLLQAAYQFTDAFWVGRLGGGAVAAVSVSFPITFLAISLGAGLGIAGSTLVAQYMGAKNEKMVNHVSAQTLLMVLVTSVFLGAIGFAFAPAILHAMGIASDIFANALGFLRVSFVGLVFTFGFAMFQAIMRGVGQVKIPVIIVLCTVLLNFALDPFFIFGWGPIPAYGVMGAALATLGTQSLAMAIGMFFLFRGKMGIHLSLSDFIPDWPLIKRSFLIGFPASIEQTVRGFGMTALTFLVASFGTLAVAVFGVGFNAFQFVMIPGMGFSMAIATLVGQNIGAGKIDRAARIAKLGTLISFVILMGIAVLVYVLATPFITFLVPHDAAVIEAGAVYVRILTYSFGFIAIQFSLTGVFRAAGKMFATMVIVLVQWAVQFPAAYFLSKHTSLGVLGLWWAFPFANAVIAAVTIVWFMKGDWKTGRLTEEARFAEKVTEEIIIEEGAR